MNNLDMPAMAQQVMIDAYGDIVTASEHDKDYMGLTKREQFCLTMGVAETGDTELDAIITKGNKQKLVGLAMQGLLSDNGNKDADVCASFAVKYSDVLRKALEASYE